jgi:hypothetical protein
LVAATPGHDRDFRSLGRIKAGADRGIGKDHVDDRGRAALGKILNRGVRLICIACRIDDGDLPADVLRSGLRPSDIAGVVGLGGGDRDDTNERLLGDRR